MRVIIGFCLFFIGNDIFYSNLAPVSLFLKLYNIQMMRRGSEERVVENVVQKGAMPKSLCVGRGGGGAGPPPL